MLDAKARWTLSEVQEDAAARLAEELKLHPLVARLLAVRGIMETREAERFLEGGAERFHDPFGLKGMEAAVGRIRLGLERNENIRVYGDYDADGISSTTLMIRLLNRLNASFDTYIPHRVHEGYGLNKAALDDAKDKGISLIITVDTGISAREEVAYAAELGIDVVVTDHHEPPELLPDAVAVVNPKQHDCPYPFKHLAGVGVAFKLAHALLGEPPLEWLEIAAIGTVADLMPLTDENRLIVKLGLERMRNTSNTGLKALLGVAGIERSEVTETHIGFALAPRINASGRLNHANMAVKLLTTNSEQEAEHLAFDLDMLNKERQKIVEDITKEAHAQIAERELNAPDRRVIVVSGTGWNVGVVGIVASKLLEKYYRPTLVLAVDPDTGMAKGSARSIAGFDIFQALSACGELMDHYGGHQAAAGLSLPAERLPELAERLEGLAGEWLSDEDFIPILQADIICSLQDASLACIEQLSRLAPFGNGNPSPRFVFEGLTIAEKRTMGKEQQHLKLVLAAAETEAACTVEAVGFGYGALAGRIAPTARLDVLGELSVNEWNGTRRPQIMIQDLRIPAPQVFDWRGTKGAAGGRPSQPPAGCGIVVFAPGEEALVPAVWSGLPLWRLKGSGGEPQPLNTEAERSDFGGLRDLILYTLPSGEEQLRNGLSRLKRIERIYAVFAEENGGVPGSLPDRDAFKSLYALLNKQERIADSDERIWSGLSKRTGLSRSAIRFVLQVFEELGFLQREGTQLAMVKTPVKRELAESETYRMLMNRGRMEQLYIYSSAAELTGHLLTGLAAGT